MPPSHAGPFHPNASPCPGPGLPDFEGGSPSLLELPSCPAPANLWALLVSFLSPGPVFCSTFFPSCQRRASPSPHPGPCCQASCGSLNNLTFAEGLPANSPPAHPWPLLSENSNWPPKAGATSRWGLQWRGFRPLGRGSGELFLSTHSGMS